MQKATNHRKRHLPPGPCGVWFQTQQQLCSTDTGTTPHEETGLLAHSLTVRQIDSNTNTTTTPHSRSSSNNKQQQRSNYLTSSSPVIPSDEDSANNKPTTTTYDDVSFSPAWMCMQQSLNICTPYLPTWYTPEQRYSRLRPHIPSPYVLLHEIAKGEYDFTLSSSDHSEKRLLVLVHAVESSHMMNIWTVELVDETGRMIRAWMEPAYVQEQLQQQPANGSTIRPGVVWMLRQVGMIATISSNHDVERVERMLLISNKHVERIWTPEQAKAMGDSPQCQREFFDWMDKRKAIRVAKDDEDDDEGQDNVNMESDEEERDGDEFDDSDSKNSSSQVDLEATLDAASCLQLPLPLTCSNKFFLSANVTDEPGDNGNGITALASRIMLQSGESPTKPSTHLNPSATDRAPATAETSSPAQEIRAECHKEVVLSSPYHSRTDLLLSRQNTSDDQPLKEKKRARDAEKPSTQGNFAQSLDVVEGPGLSATSIDGDILYYRTSQEDRKLESGESSPMERDRRKGKEEKLPSSCLQKRHSNANSIWNIEDESILNMLSEDGEYSEFPCGRHHLEGNKLPGGRHHQERPFRELDPKTERRSQTEAKNNDNHSSGMPTMDQKSFSLFDATNLENLDIDILLDDD